MSSNLQKAQTSLNTMTPAQIVSDQKVKDKFLQLYKVIHGKANGEVFYEQEKYHFMKRIQESPQLSNCDKLSIYGSFIDIAVNGLSADPNLKQVYLVPYGGKCTVAISPYGELFLRTRSGQIKHADNPVLVYEGDHFQTGIRGGETFIEHTAAYPRKSEHIIACYIRLVRPDGTVDFKVLSENEFEALRKMSKQPNSPAYTTGRAGMFMAKTIKHAFKSYPRVKVKGDFSKVEEEIEVEEIDYSLADTPSVTAEATTLTEAQPSAAASAVISAMTADENQQGHVVNIDNDGDPFGN